MWIKETVGGARKVHGLWSPPGVSGDSFASDSTLAEVSRYGVCTSHSPVTLYIVHVAKHLLATIEACRKLPYGRAFS